MSKAGKEIECLQKLDELTSCYDELLEFLQSEKLLTREESRAIRSSADIAKMIHTKLLVLSKTDKLQLLEFMWEVLPIERIKITIITDRMTKELAYGY